MAETTTEKDAAATTDPAEAKPKRMSRRKAVEQHARSYFDALARRDANGMGEHWADDGVVEIVPLGIMRGRHEIKSFFFDLFAAFPDMETKVTRLVASDSLAAVEWRMEGNFSGAAFQEIEPNGKRVELRGIDLLEVENGQIKGNTAYYDGMAFARQIGMMPAQDSGAEKAMKSAFNAVTKARRAIADRTSA
jgi:steroid delta-isomerase-like uncharacterized protein